ncbi:hypothetical protein BRADI_5g09714v3 [Brachypodium distachyon]|uniref:Uncharacterized protein n=1 Tax=Brachypodium distachyon TaxID=15368 RepID=A0A0Q3H352_BRADI|nr:hypothetical protein BRADI_5g09714v3 [Brachypodium distachyon]
MHGKKLAVLLCRISYLQLFYRFSLALIITRAMLDQSVNLQVLHISLYTGICITHASFHIFLFDKRSKIFKGGVSSADSPPQVSLTTTVAVPLLRHRRAI